MLDGLILAGGADIDPATYGAEPPPEDRRHAARSATRSRSRWRARALERDLPVLGICRGMQLINVARGGTLIQHLPDDVGHERPPPRARAPSTTPTTTCAWRRGSLAARGGGEIGHATKSHHHQAVAALGEGVVATGWSALDELRRGDRGSRRARSRWA